METPRQNGLSKSAGTEQGTPKRVSVPFHLDVLEVAEYRAAAEGINDGIVNLRTVGGYGSQVVSDDVVIQTRPDTVVLVINAFPNQITALTAQVERIRAERANPQD